MHRNTKPIRKKMLLHINFQWALKSHYRKVQLDICWFSDDFEFWTTEIHYESNSYCQAIQNRLQIDFFNASEHNSEGYTFMKLANV